MDNNRFIVALENLNAFSEEIKQREQNRVEADGALVAALKEVVQFLGVSKLENAELEKLNSALKKEASEYRRKLLPIPDFGEQVPWKNWIKYCEDIIMQKQLLTNDQLEIWKNSSGSVALSKYLQTMWRNSKSDLKTAYTNPFLVGQVAAGNLDANKIEQLKQGNLPDQNQNWPSLIFANMKGSNFCKFSFPRNALMSNENRAFVIETMKLWAEQN